VRPGVLFECETGGGGTPKSGECENGGESERTGKALGACRRGGSLSRLLSSRLLPKARGAPIKQCGETMCGKGKEMIERRKPLRSV
jgi:hypothetical protein